MKRLVAALLLLSAAGCALGPNYKRPSTPMSDRFRGQARAEAESFADLPWWDAFQDPALGALVREAIEHNFDLQDAIARVEVAAQNAHIATDQLMPALGIQGGPSYQRAFSPISAQGGRSGSLPYAAYTLEATLSWELDLWGRLRRLRQAAVANFLASEENRRGVIVSLIGQVAQGYYNLVSLDMQLEVAKQTVASRRQTLALFQEQEAGGVGNRLQTASEEANMADAEAIVPNLERQIAQTENQLAVLLGRVPGPIARAQGFLGRAAPPDRPTGLPASLLERRPDVRQVEAQLMAANAQVGAAYAALFPRIEISADGGVESTSLAQLFMTGALTFGVGLVVNWLAPLLNGAQYAHQYRGQQANFVAAVADYRRTVVTALADVANALVAITTLRTQRAALEHEVAARVESVKLSKERFHIGVVGYLDVVQAEQNLFPAQLQLAQTVASQFLAETQLYRALGGGWHSDR